MMSNKEWYDDYEYQEDSDDILDDNAGEPIKYIIYRYFPKKILINRYGVKTLRKSCWKAIPQTYTPKQLDSLSPHYWQYGDVFKVRRCN